MNFQIFYVDSKPKKKQKIEEKGQKNTLDNYNIKNSKINNRTENNINKIDINNINNDKNVNKNEINNINKIDKNNKNNNKNVNKNNVIKEEDEKPLLDKRFQVLLFLYIFSLFILFCV